MGVRKDGITLVDLEGTGAGTPVDITAPLGLNVSADSVSVVLATDHPPIDVVISAPVTIVEPVTVNAIDLDIRDLVFVSDKVDISGSSVDITDDPTRDLGKVDIASLDQYIPIAGRLPVDGSGVTQPISAIDLDIRDLVFATDKIDMSGSIVDISDDAIRDLGIVSVDNFPASQLVTAVDLDIRNLTFATDKVDISGSTVAVSGSVTIDEPVTVDAVDLDIRNLLFATDRVDVSDSVVSTKADLTPSSPTFATVGTGSALAVAASATRKGLELVNLSNGLISLAFGTGAILRSGVTLYPGGSFHMDEFSFDLGTVNAIASNPASILSIQEYLT